MVIQIQSVAQLARKRSSMVVARWLALSAALSKAFFAFQLRSYYHSVFWVIHRIGALQMSQWIPLRRVNESAVPSLLFDRRKLHDTAAHAATQVLRWIRFR